MTRNCIFDKHFYKKIIFLQGEFTVTSTIRQLVSTEKPLVLPGAHDALSALLIKQAGFKAFFIGGFQTAGARYGVPDIGLLALGEFAAAYQPGAHAY